MILEKTKNGLLNISISKKVDSFGLQRVLNYIKYLELANKTTATQKDADLLAQDLNNKWWEKNRKRFVHGESNS
jgi:predicted trehalose synthase